MNTEIIYFFIATRMLQAFFQDDNKGGFTVKCYPIKDVLTVEHTGTTTMIAGDSQNNLQIIYRFFDRQRQIKKIGHKTSRWRAPEKISFSKSFDKPYKKKQYYFGKYPILR